MRDPFDATQAQGADPFDATQSGKPPEPEGRSALGAIGDYAASFMSGAAGASQAAAQAGGAKNTVADSLDAAAGYAQGKMTPQGQEALSRAHAGLREALAQENVVDQITGAAGAFMEAPGMLSAQAAGSLLPVALAARFGAPAVTALGAAMGAGGVKGAIYEDQIARGASPEQADAAQAYSGPNVDQIAAGAAMGVLDVKTGAEKALAGGMKSGTGNIVTRAAKGAVGEVPVEAAQGGQEKLATNVAAQRAGHDVDTWAGVAAQAAFEGMASLVPGAIVGAANRPAGPLSVAAEVGKVSGATQGAGAQETASGDPFDATQGDTPSMSQEAAQAAANAAGRAGEQLEVQPHPTQPGRSTVLPPATGLTVEQPEKTDVTQAPEAVQAEAQGPQPPAAPVGRPAGEQPAAEQPLDPAAQQVAAEAAGGPAAPVARHQPGVDYNAEPTDPQKAAGNYKKVHETYEGLPLTLENPIGSVRRGTDADGVSWETPMEEADYGYVKRTRGADTPADAKKAEQIDVYVAKERTPGAPVFVIDQLDLNSGQFDEHKVILGAANQQRAEDIYDAGFADGTGPERRAAVTQMTMAEFKAWSRAADTSMPAVAKADEVRTNLLVNDGIIPAPEVDSTPSDQGLFPSVPAALKYARDNGISAEALQAEGGFTLAPKVEPQKDLKDAAPRLAALNQELGYGEVAGVTPLREVPTPQAALAKHVAERAFGVRTVLVNSNPDFDGVAHNGTVFLAPEEQHPVIAIAGHEVKHVLAEDGEVGAAFDEVLTQYAHNLPKQVAARLRLENKAMKSMGRDPVDADYARREIAADLNGAMWMDTNFWSQMLAKDEKLFRKVAYKFMELATKAIKVAKGSRFDAATIVRDVDAARDAISTAWVNHLQGKHTAKVQNKLAASVKASPFAGLPGIPQQMPTSAQVEEKRMAGAVSTIQAPDTPEFKAWFGRSGDNPFVAEGGKARVMYHGTARDITTFRPKQAKAIFVTPKPRFAEDFADASENWIAEHYLQEMNDEQRAAAKKQAVAEMKKNIKDDFGFDPNGEEAQQVQWEIENDQWQDKGSSGIGQDYMGRALREQMPTRGNIMPVFVRAERTFDYENPDHVRYVVSALNEETDARGNPVRGSMYEGHLKRGDWQTIENPIVQRAIKAVGFDSFTMHEGGVKNLAVYDPNQIKSATGNTGEFSRENPDIRFAAKERPDMSHLSHERYGEEATRAGLYVGAPTKYNSPSKIVHLRRLFMQLAKEGEPGKLWYERSGREVLAMTGYDPVEAEKLVSLLAIYSPQAAVDANSTFAMRAWAQYKNGEPIKVKTGHQDRQASEKVYEGKPWGGEKTNNFYINLMREVDALVGNPDSQGVTVDMWMMRAAGFDRDVPTAAGYRFVEKETMRLALEMGWEPQQAQAAIWVAMKARTENSEVKKKTIEASIKKGFSHYEQGKKGRVLVVDNEIEHRKLWLKTALAHKVTGEDIAKASFDYADGLRRHMGQVSWEARPGRSTGVLPGVNDAPYEQQAEFQLAMAKALTGARGEDLLAQKLGLLVDGKVMAPGVWMNEVAPSHQEFMVMAPVVGGEADGKAEVDPAQKALINAYADIMGLLLRQEGVGWHKPYYNVAKNKHNGVEVNAGRVLEPAETLALEKSLTEVLKAMGKAEAMSDIGFISTDRGIRVVSFDHFNDTPRFKDNKEFRDAVARALARTPGEFTAELRSFASDGDLRTNDWKEHPNGEGYRQRVSAAGRSDVLRWAEDVLAPAVQAVHEDFSKRYGWGKPVRFSSKHPDAGLGREAEAVPEYGRGSAPGAIRVVGRHYSDAQRTTLNGAAYGRGLKGAERERAQQAEDKRLRSRVYFYVDTGKGIRPESGVGAYAHEVALTNVYDVTTRTIKAKDANSFESAVLDAGYDGYYIPDFTTTQGAVVLLGDHSVPVKAVGQPKDAPAPQAAAPTVLKRALMSKEISAIEVGNIPGATLKFGTLSIPAESMDAANAELERIGGPTRFTAVNFSPKGLGSTRAHTPQQVAAMANVGFATQPLTMKQRWDNLQRDLGKKLAQGIADQFMPIKELDKKAYALARLAKGASGAFETLLQGGKLKLVDDVYDFDTSGRGGVIERLLKPLQGEHHDFLMWVAAMRAEQLMAQGRERLFSPQDIAALKSLADGRTTWDYTTQHGQGAGSVTRDRRTIYADALKTLNEFNRNVLDMAEQSGLIDGGSRPMWESMFYVPFYRVTGDDGFKGLNIKSSIVRQEAFKHLKGGTDKLNQDLLHNVLMNWSHLLDASAKNRAAKATLEAAERMGVAINTSQSTATQMGNATHNRKGVVWFMENGVKRYYLVDDPYVLTAITSMEYAGMRNPVMNAMGSMKHYLTVGVTASPFFKIKNLIRDSLTVIGTGPISYNVPKNLAQGWKDTKPGTDAYFQLLAGGGTIHFGSMVEGSEAKRVDMLVKRGVNPNTILNTQQKVDKFWGGLRWMLDYYNEVGNRGEAINRAALYKQLRAQGKSHAEASLEARDLMDFSMQGTFTTIRFLTQVVPFFNARIQGMYKLGRAGKEDPRRMAAVVAATSLATVALAMAYDGDDDWDKREDWDRNNFWWFKIGGTAFRIPKPFEIGAVATLAERTWELGFSKEMTVKRYGKNVWDLLKDNLSMNPVPQLVKPMLDVYANKDSFTGRPIESLSMEKLRPDYRFTERTSMTARAASTAMTSVLGDGALSPVQIDHLLRGYFGWLGATSVAAADIALRPITGQAERPASDTLKTLTGNLASSLEDAPSRYVTQFYEDAKAYEEAHHTYRNLMKQGKTEEARDFLEANRAEIARQPAAAMAKRVISNINEQIRVIERSNSDPDAKATAIRELNARKEQISRRVTATQ